MEKIASRVLHQPILFVSLSFAFLNFGLPIYAKALGASALEIGGLFSILTLSLALLRPAVGWAIDRFGRKAFLVAGLACYAGSMALFALAASLTGFYLARLVQGLASAMTWITVSTIIADLAGAVCLLSAGWVMVTLHKKPIARSTPESLSQL
jgi:MFS family permease